MALLHLIVNRNLPPLMHIFEAKCGLNFKAQVVSYDIKKTGVIYPSYFAHNVHVFQACPDDFLGNYLMNSTELCFINCTPQKVAAPNYSSVENLNIFFSANDCRKIINLAALNSYKYA